MAETGNETNAPPITPFNLWFPINRHMQIEDPTEGILAGNNTFKWGTYYLVIQAIRTTNATAAETAAQMDYRISVFYRDP